MACDLTVMTWNLRCFGSRDNKPDELRLMVNTILGSNADIVCIQELTTGSKCGPKIESPIGKSNQKRLKTLLQALQKADHPLADWQCAYTGSNKEPEKNDKNKGHPDAYGFLWKSAPDESNYSYADALSSIEPLAGAKVATYGKNPCILRLKNSANVSFPGRRPGMMVFELGYYDVNNVKQTLILNLVTLHAKLPNDVNYDSSGKEAAGRAIWKLFWLPEVGGSGPKNKPSVAVPKVKVVVGGDFNFKLSNPKAISPNPYSVPAPSYVFRLGTIANDVKTTYSTKDTNPPVSSYDNIFDNEATQTDFIFVSADRIDFITNAATSLGISYPVAYKRFYGVQIGNKYVNRIGVSDHMPVVAQYQIG